MPFQQHRILSILLSGFAILANCALINAQERWIEVVPELGAAVDIASIRNVSNEYEARLRWKIFNPNIDVYRDYHLPENSFTVATEHIACTTRGPIGYQVEHWFETSNRKKLYFKQFAQSEQTEARLRQEKWLDDTQTPWSQLLSPYGSDPRSFVCAYVAAKCGQLPFHWPIHNLAPLEGPIDQLRKMNQAHTAKFLPVCKQY